MYLSLIVLIPLAALTTKAFDNGVSGFWDAVSSPEAWAALKLTVFTGLGVSIVNAIFGTLIAWVLVRDKFPGKAILEAVIDLPFALPTIVAGLILLALYGVQSPIGVDLAFKVSGVVMALLFVTLPFVVRTVEPVLIELDQEMEEAAVSLGASRHDDVPAGGVPQPPAGDRVRHRALVRPGHQRVRLHRADLRQPAVQDPGLGGLHLRTDRE